MPNYKIIEKTEAVHDAFVFVKVLLCTNVGVCEEQVHIVGKSEVLEKVLSAAAWRWQESQPSAPEEKEVFAVTEALPKNQL